MRLLLLAVLVAMFIGTAQAQEMLRSASGGSQLHPISEAKNIERLPPKTETANQQQNAPVSPRVVPRLPMLSKVGSHHQEKRSARSVIEPLAVEPDRADQDFQTVPSYQNLSVLSEKHQVWSELLAAYTHPTETGLIVVDYAALKGSDKGMKLLQGYIDALARQSPSAIPRAEAMAYWANLYNALTVQIVAENYPIDSIRDIKSGLRKGPWKRKLVTVEGRKLSLDNIEHDIMRPAFKSPLVHYMVNCASIGCPNLKMSAWQAQTLDADLERAARAYINSPRGVSIKDDRLMVSSIYKWFMEDFGGNQAGVITHLLDYADADLAAQLRKYDKISKYKYDWAINAP